MQNPSHKYSNTGQYSVLLIVTNEYKCSDSAIINFNIEDLFTFFAPSAFSPDIDGKNDEFLPKGTGWDEKTFVMCIYNRWGELLFSSTDANKGWKGLPDAGSKIAQDDVYVWLVNLADLGGKKHSYTGRVTLLK